MLYIESAEKILNRPGPARPEANTMRNYRFGYVFLAPEKELRIRQIATRAHRAVFFLVTRFFDGPCYLYLGPAYLGVFVKTGIFGPIFELPLALILYSLIDYIYLYHAFVLHTQHIRTCHKK